MKNLLLALPLLALTTLASASPLNLPLVAFTPGLTDGLLSDIPLTQESVPDGTMGPLMENQCWASQCAQKAADRSTAAGFSAMATLPPDGTQWKDPVNCNHPPCALKDGPTAPSHEAAIVPAPNGGFVVANDKGVTVVDRRGRTDVEATRRLKEEQERMAREQREAQDRGFNPTGGFNTPPGSTARGGSTTPDIASVSGGDLGGLFGLGIGDALRGGGSGSGTSADGSGSGSSGDQTQYTPVTFDDVLKTTGRWKQLDKAETVVGRLGRDLRSPFGPQPGAGEGNAPAEEDAVTPACGSNSLANGTCINNN